MTQAVKPGRRLRQQALRAHRWLSLAAAIFWMIQAITGVLIVFHWEIEDAAISFKHRPTDLVAIERRLATLTPPGSGLHIKSLWVTAGLADRYDITVTDGAGKQRAVRITGDGTVLRVKDKARRGIMDVLVSVHQTLLAGDVGEWMVGISGTLLFSNLILGLISAWPRRGTWRRALTPSQKGGMLARLYSWHRAIGLWAAVPALVLVGSGVLLRFEDGVSALIGAKPVEMSPIPPGTAAPIGFSRAIRIAETALPGGKLAAVAMPTDTDRTYRVRLLAPDELRRAYGTSVVFVDADTGLVRGLSSARDAAAPRAFMDGLYAIHTGEAGGLVGRLLVAALGMWLLAMLTAGILLWSRRRRRPA